MAKKIAVIYSGAKNWGGVERYLLTLFKKAPKSVEIVLFSLGEWPLTKKVEKADGSIKIFSGKRIRFRTIFEISRYLRKEKYNLIVSAGAVSSAYGRAASLLSGLPIVVTVHSAPGFDYPNRLYNFFHKTAAIISRWKTTKYIAVSEFIKKELIKSGVKGNIIEVIYNGVEPVEVKRKENTKIIGSIGRLHHVKNYRELLNAAQSLYLRYGYRLKIWGEGEEREKLEKNMSIPNSEVTDFASLEGHIDDIKEALGEIEIYVQPSLSEGFGITVVEAMLAGLPVVVTPGGSLPEIVQDGKTGIIATGFGQKDLIQAIEKLIKDPKKRAELAKTGQKSARERFSVEVWLERTVKVFLETAK